MSRNRVVALELVNPGIESREVDLELLDLFLVLLHHAGHLREQGVHLVCERGAELVKGLLLCLK